MFDLPSSEFPPYQHLEHASVMYPEAQQRLEAGTVRLGHDHCAVCGVQLRPKAGTDCTQCRRVRYCNPAHRKQDRKAHKDVCAALGSLNADDRFEAANGAKLQASLSSILLSITVPASTEGGLAGGLATWADYFRAEPTADRPAKRQKKSSSQASHWCDGTRGRYLTASLTYPLTLAALLSEFSKDLLPSPKSSTSAASAALSTSGEITLHIIGASAAEATLNHLWLELSRLTLPLAMGRTAVKHMNLVFVGPQMPSSLHGIRRELPSPDPDRGCTVYSFSGLYHDFIEKGLADWQSHGHHVSRPDLVVGYHMGLSCPDYDWDATMKTALAWNVRIVTTCYTQEEQRMETEIWNKQYGCEVVACLGDGQIGQCQLLSYRNPFAARKVIQSGTLANDIHYRNSFVTVYQGTAVQKT